LDVPIRNCPSVAATTEKPSDEQGILLNHAKNIIGGEELY